MTINLMQQKIKNVKATSPFFLEISLLSYNIIFYGIYVTLAVRTLWSSTWFPLLIGIFFLLFFFFLLPPGKISSFFFPLNVNNSLKFSHFVKTFSLIFPSLFPDPLQSCADLCVSPSAAHTTSTTIKYSGKLENFKQHSKTF